MPPEMEVALRYWNGRVGILGFHPSVILQVNLMLIGMGVGRGAGAVP